MEMIWKTVDKTLYFILPVILIFGIYAIHTSNETTNYFLPYNTKNSSSILTISVDKSTYIPGETMYFLGKVNHYNVSAKVQLLARDSENNIIGEFTALINDNGIFSGTFTIPETLSNGKYLLSVYYLGDPEKKQVSLVIPVSNGLAEAYVNIPRDATNEEAKLNFEPPVINTTEGFKIVWTNKDDTIHSVFSGKPDAYGNISPDNLFVGSFIKPQEKFELSLKAGTYQYYCKLHPWLVGFVYVNVNPSSNNQIPTPAVTTTSSNVTGLSFPVSYSTLLSIWNQRPDLQKSIPEVAQGDITSLKEWAVDYGWNAYPSLSPLIPPGKVPSYLQSSIPVSNIASNSLCQSPPTTGDWIIGTSCTLATSTTVSTNATVQSGATLTINPDQTLTINPGFRFTNDGTISNSGIISNSGYIAFGYSSTTTNNSNGTINNNSEGTIDNVGTTITNAGTISNSGTILSNPGNVTNSGTISGTGTFTSALVLITNTGTITDPVIIPDTILSSNYTLNFPVIVSSGVTLTINPGIKITISSSVSNSGTISNSGYIAIGYDKSINNVGTIINNPDGTINNVGTTITNSGTISNSGTILSNPGNVTNSGTISGTGTFTYSLASIKNTGTITYLTTNKDIIKSNIGANTSDFSKIKNVLVILVIIIIIAIVAAVIVIKLLKRRDVERNKNPMQKS